MIAGQLDRQDGCLTARCIGAYGHRQQIKAGFIDKNDRTLLPFGFFSAERQTLLEQAGLQSSEVGGKIFAKAPLLPTSFFPLL